jgi:predicted Rossmann-fold nucleotide-binding protein
MIVGVMASGRRLKDEEERLADEVGTAIAELGYHLLTGGGGGSMEAVGQAFLKKKRELVQENRPVWESDKYPESKGVTADRKGNGKTNLASKRGQ